MISKWETLNSKEQGRGKIFRHRVVTRKSPDSGNSGEFDVIDCLNWVNVVALNSEGHFVMVKQYRHGSNDVTLEIPGGAIDLGEDPKQAAMRELEEETGYKCDEMILLGKVRPNPAFMTNHCYTFLAKNCHLSSNQNLDHLEEIDVVIIDQTEIKNKIKSGEIDHSLVIAAFHYFFTR